MPRTLCASVSELLGGTCDFDGISPPPDLQADNLSRAMNSVPEDLRSAGAEADEGSKQVPRTTKPRARVLPCVDRPRPRQRLLRELRA